MTTQLALYNGALLLCGETQLTTTTDDVESRYKLDLAWNDPGYRYCLEQGQWNFALRASKLDYDTSVTPNWGYTRAYSKPTDWVQWIALSGDEYFAEPLTRYAFEAGYIYADLDSIYVQYVSSDASFGGDLANWPAAFTEYVKAWLASKIVWSLTTSKEKTDAVMRALKKAETDAKGVDAMGEPTQFPPPGAWVSARRYGTRSDRGNRGSLIG